MVFLIGVGLDDTHGFSLIVLIYNLGDLIGKYSYKFTPMDDTPKVYIYCLVRNAFIAIMYICMFMNPENYILRNPVTSIIMQLILSITNGHFTTLCFAIAPHRVDDNYKKYTGFIMVTALLFGLTYGAMVSLFTIESSPG